MPADNPIHCRNQGVVAPGGNLPSLFLQCEIIEQYDEDTAVIQTQKCVHIHVKVVLWNHVHVCLKSRCFSEYDLF